MTEVDVVEHEKSFEQLNCGNDNPDYYGNNSTTFKDSDILESCCLCADGCEIQNSLIEHLENEHQNELQSNKILRCCDCSEGILLQVELINHLLSHIILKSGTDKFLDKENIEIVEHTESIDENQEQAIKLKPSYHNKFNRRGRSPNTQTIQQEFTRDPVTKLFHCNFCRNSYKHKQTVERHLSKVHYPVESDNGSFDDLTTELGFTLDPNTRMFSCNICSSSYKHKQTVERHITKQHKIVVPKARLNTRLINVIRKERIEINKTKKDKNLICDFCGHHFLFRESLRKHLLRHINPITNVTKTGRPIKEKIVCDQCTKLVDRSLMKRHLQVHHSDYRPFRCEEPGCKTSFFDATKFNDHKNIHLKIKPYVCEFCQESFHYASNWRQHKLRHTDPDRFKCEICSHCFVSSKSLSLHMRLHTEVDPDAPKPFACDHDGCDKAFRFLDRLKLHVFNVHRTEIEHKCTLCSFVSHRKKYHKRHLMKVHNIREGNPRNRVFPVSHQIA